MYKPSSTFKLSKTSKRMIAAQTNKKYADALKRCFIEAQIIGSIPVKPLKGKRDEAGE